MARLKVSSHLLLDSLFKGTHPMVDLRAVSFDAQQQIVELDIVGPSVPAVEHVIAECQVEKFNITFKPIKA